METNCNANCFKCPEGNQDDCGYRNLMGNQASRGYLPIPDCEELRKEYFLSVPPLAFGLQELQNLQVLLETGNTENALTIIKRSQDILRALRCDIEYTLASRFAESLSGEVDAISQGNQDYLASFGRYKVREKK